MQKVLVLLPATMLLLGCRARPSAEGETVVLFSAASTGDVMDEIKERFEQKHGIRIRADYAATSTLVQQIMHQAGADVFVSANTRWADYLSERGLVASRQDLLRNSLVIVVPQDSDISVKEPEDLLAGEIRHVALADPDGVPAGLYAKQALENLGLWEQLEDRIAPAADVRRALTFVETGAADAGLVYATDAARAPSVRVAVELDEELTDPICYPVALLKGAEHKLAAKTFYRYLTCTEAAEVFRTHGFRVLFKPVE